MKVLGEARARVSLEQMGIPPLRIRATASGARLLEVPGADRAEKADALAAKLRELFAGDEDVRVSRPCATADLRVYGLEDSVGRDELLAALASAGGCDVADIRLGEIGRGPAGMGMAFVRCPVPAAKKIGSSIRIGWGAVRVQLEQPRARRCFRCLAEGHLRAQCKAEVDRSDECYRCGKEGHTSRGCSASPHCNLCAAVGKPASHLPGGKGCAKPPVKGRPRTKPAATEGEPQSQPAGPSGEQAATMEE